MRSIARTPFLFLICASLLPAQINVLTANYDFARTSSNTQETILNLSNVSAASFGKIGAFPVDGQIFAQPLYVNGVQIAGKGKRNVVYVVTMHNSVYAIDADDSANPLPLWRVNLGPSVLTSHLAVYYAPNLLTFDDIDPEVGILSTPVIDQSRNLIYLVSDTFEQGLPVYKLHALSLADGSEQLGGPVKIAAMVKGTGDAQQGGQISFDAFQHLQRPGLLLLNGVIYLGFGSHGDIPPFHGWLMSYDASNLNQLKVLNITPNGNYAALWQCGRAPAVDSDGNIYVATSNGDYDGVNNFGQSFLKITAQLAILDWFTPVDWSPLSYNDEDIGSQGPILIPGTNLLIGGGKGGTIYMVDTTNMGHLGGAPTEVFPSINVAGIDNMALWTQNAQTSVAYVQEQGSPLKAYRVVGGHFQSNIYSQTTFPTGGYPYQGFSISSNANKADTAIVWENVGSQDLPGIPGTLYAFNASDLTQVLWSSKMVPERDVLGAFAKFANPTVANGKVYVPTFSHELMIYGLLPNSSGVQPMQIAAVSNGGSFVEGPVSPGEVVAIFGNGLGPANLAGTQLDSNGRVTKELAGTQVTFNGVAAPLLYTSATQVGALVPFSVSAASGHIKVAVSYAGNSTEFTTAALDSAPAIFSMDSSGAGQGAVLNQDGTVNSSKHPAKIGSTIVLYATGLGKTNPVQSDGGVASSDPGAKLPVPVQAVSVQIGGSDAKVVYAGAAPGLVAGVFQINATVPSVFASDEVPVIINVGGQISQAALSVALTQ